MRPLEPGTIVIIECGDIRRGQIRAPGLVRYYVPEYDAYEVSVLFRPDHDAPADMDDIGWWTVSPESIVATLGVAETEKPVEKTSGEKTWRSVRFVPQEVTG